jgi:hypothetical protein
MEDNLIYIKFFFKRKMTSIYLRMEDDLTKEYIYNDEDKDTENSGFTSTFNRCLEQHKMTSFVQFCMKYI